VVLGFVIGLYFFMRSIGSGQLAQEIYRPHSDRNAYPSRYEPADPPANDSATGGLTGAAGATGGSAGDTGGSTGST